MINWKKVGEYVPTNENKPFAGAPNTPYVICIAWIANPNVIKGGFPITIRFDTNNNVWLVDELSRGEQAWLSLPHIEITHFCDDINSPAFIEAPADNTATDHTDTPQEKYNKG